MATGKAPAKRPASPVTTSGIIGTVTDTAVGSARTLAAGRKLARTWQDIAIPAAGAASLLGATEALSPDLWVVPQGSPTTIAVTAVTAGCAARYAASDHAKAMRQRRKVETALRQAGILEPPSPLHPHGRVPRVLRPTPTKAGAKVRVQVPKGSAALVIERLAPALERNLGQVSVRPVPPPDGLARRTVTAAMRATPLLPTPPERQLLAYGWVELNLRQRESLAGPPPVWRHLAEMRKPGFAGLSVWDGWHKGVDEDGEDVDLTLVQRNKLSGGEMGTGKSTDEHVDIAAVALDPTARLFLLDPSGLAELGVWVPVANGAAGDADSCARLLARLHAEGLEKLSRIDAERESRAAAGLPSANVAPGEQTTWIFVDELLALTNHPNRDVRAECVGMLADIVGRFRKVGFHVACSTLKPSGDVIPTFLRDLIAIRQVFRCATVEGSTAVLGDKHWAAMGFGGHLIDLDAPKGVSYLLAQGGYPRRMRGCNLSDAERAEVLQVALRLRGGHPALAGPAPRPISVTKSAPAPVAVELATPPATPETPARSRPVTPAAGPAPAPSLEPTADPGAARRAHNATQFAARRRNRPGPADRRLRPVDTPKDDR